MGLGGTRGAQSASFDSDLAKAEGAAPKLGTVSPSDIFDFLAATVSLGTELAFRLDGATLDGGLEATESGEGSTVGGL